MTVADFAAWIALSLFAGAMVYAGLKDMTTMTITNRLVLCLAAGYLVLAPLAGFALADISGSLGVALAVLVCAFALFAFGWIGGGDAKLSAVAVLWLGSELAVEYIFYTAVSGTLLTLALLQFRNMPLPIMLQGRSWTARLHAAETGVPYGVALGAAALLLLPESRWATALL